MHRRFGFFAIAFLIIEFASSPLLAQSENGSWQRLAGRLRAVEKTYKQWGITVEVEKDFGLSRAAGPTLSSLKVAGGLESSDTFKLDAEAGLGNKNALGVVLSGTFKTGPDGNSLTGSGTLHLKGSGIGGKFQYTREDGFVLEAGLDETFYSLGVKIGGDGRSPISIGLKGGPVTVKIDPVKYVTHCREVLPAMLKKAGQKVGGVLIHTDLEFLAAALANAPAPSVSSLRDVIVISLKRLLAAARSGRASDLRPITTITGLVYDGEAGDVLLMGRAESGMAPVPLSTVITLLRSAWRDGLTPYVSLDPDPATKQPRLVPRVGGVSPGLEDSPMIASMLEADYRIKSVIYGDTIVEGIKPATTAIAESKGMLGAGAARFWFTPRPIESGDIAAVRTSQGSVFTFDSQPLLLSETTTQTSGMGQGGMDQPLEPILNLLAAQITARYADLERSRPELSLKPLRQTFEMATVCAILRKEAPPAVCAALLRRYAALPVKDVSTRGPYEPVQKTIPIAGFDQGMKLWGGANATVDLREAKFRTERAMGAQLRRIQAMRWKGWSGSLRAAFDPVIANAELLDRAELAQPHLDEAKRLLQARQYADAIAELDRALELTPDSVQAYLLRAGAHFFSEKLVPMLADAGQAVRLAPKDARGHYWLGLALNELNRQEEALVEAETAVRLSPTSVDFILLQAAVKRDVRTYAESIKDFDLAVKLAPRNAFALFERGLTYAQSRNFPKAIADYTASLALNPRSVQCLKARAQLYFDRGQHALGVADYARIAETRPSSAAYAELAGARLYTKEFQQAVEDATIAIHLDPTDPMGHMGRGLAYKEMKEYRKAIDDLETAHQLFPAFRDVIRKRIDECKRALQNP